MSDGPRTIAGAASEGAPATEKRKHRRGTGRGRRRDVSAEIQAAARARQKAWRALGTDEVSQVHAVVREPERKFDDLDDAREATAKRRTAVEFYRRNLDTKYAEKRAQQ